MAQDFVELCETLWRDWLAGVLKVSPFVDATFDTEAAPEPYISFHAGERSLVALTTNPGATMAHQLRRTVQRGNGPLNSSIDFATAARILGPFYEQELPSKNPARHRIAKLSNLAHLVGADGVLQVEACPFHSPLLSMVKKRALLLEAGEGGFMTRYVASLRGFISQHPVVVISAVSAQVSLQYGLKMSPWIEWQANIAGVNLETASFVPLVTKGPKTTCGAFVSSVDGAQKVLVLMMGSNNLPGGESLETLANTFRIASE